MGGFAWVTLATNDSYSLGALVLAHSLKKVNTKYDLAVLITPGVTEVMREKLSSVFTIVKEVNVLDSKDEANLALLSRPELGITFTKLHCWRLTQYDKCVFIDADALVIKNSDELFERDELSAAPDVGWPDCFNSGVFVFKPSQLTFASLTSHAKSHGSFDGGDQGLLNLFFSDWSHKDISKHLPFIYNMCSTATYSYLPAFKQFGEDVKIIHFIGSTKPWLQHFDTLTGQVQPHSDTGYLQPMLQHWWNIFCENVHPQLSPVMAGIAGALAKITLGETRTSEQVALEEHMRKYGWEQGQIDYMGRDSFDNIWKKINTTLESTSSKSDKTSVKTKLSSSSSSSETEEKITTKKDDKLNEKTSESIPDETTKIESAPATDKTLNEAKEILSTTIESSQVSSSLSTEQILALKAAPQILSIKEHGENLNNDNKITKREQLKISKSQDESNKSDTVIPLGFTSSSSTTTTTTTVKEDLENKDLKESESIDTEQSILPISTVESTNDTEIKTDNIDDKKITKILPEDDDNNNASEILSDKEQAQIKTDIKIPATPTIIEATPPTSPQSETTEEEIKAPKKIARKIIKKINHDDSIEGTSCTNKLINVDDNNTTELNENLEPDESVPETPPPLSSSSSSSVNPPTPPKRKSKNIIKKNNNTE